jgi:hypothetical protein
MIVILGMVGGVFLEVEDMERAGVVAGMEDEAGAKESSMTGACTLNVRMRE